MWDKNNKQKSLCIESEQIWKIKKETKKKNDKQKIELFHSIIDIMRNDLFKERDVENKTQVRVYKKWNKMPQIKSQIQTNCM